MDSFESTVLGLFPNLIESQQGTLERGDWPIALLGGVGLEVTPRRKSEIGIFYPGISQLVAIMYPQAQKNRERSV
ncbi:hypothetical protein NG791_03335 [Laspinema sp. D1]|uniref:hypothetical protein n=1 Tax=Laspinema palackyanum TaxID=3231601 RepID=UPI00348BA2A9|nr:hypothetical protein [Laspinema sp. D2b]